MNHNYRFRDVNDALPALCRHLGNSNEVGSRLGDVTRERAFVGIRLASPLDREILLPSRKANVVAQIAETMWVLSGRDDVAWLRNYLPRAEDFSDDGERWRGAYGPRLRAWGQQYPDEVGRVDQLDHVIKLLKEEPTTRRAVMTIYDPATDSSPGKDIPCNNWLSFLSRDGYLDLHVAIRSNDVIWGWSGINQFEWSALLEIVASLSGLRVGDLHFSITSLHLYDKHYKRAAEIAKDTAIEPLPLKDSPRFNANAFTDHLGGFDRAAEMWFGIEEKIRTGSPTLIREDIYEFPEPMLRSWLQVIAWYWSGNAVWLSDLRGTRLYHAALLGKPKGPVPAEDASPFVKQLGDLHAEKHAAYGDSWKARGELFSILPNIARKVDRLGTGKETADETTADTAADLLIYLIKYRLWLSENAEAPQPHGRAMWALAHVQQVGFMLSHTPRDSHLSTAALVKGIRDIFEQLLTAAERKERERYGIVDALLSLAGPLAYRLWRGPGDEPEEQMHASYDSRMAD